MTLMESKKSQKVNYHSGKGTSIWGFVALDFMVLLDTDACDESVAEAVDMIVYALNHHYLRERESQYY